jgi:pyridoxal phosphate enzyme (YggS family)
VNAGAAPGGSPAPDPGAIAVPSAVEVAAFAAARAVVLERIALACARARRDPTGVRLVAVSKNVTAERIRAAVAAGLVDLGENRVQEAATKVPLVAGARWHLIGPLQSNKARRAVELFDAVESVDSVELAGRLDRLVREVRGLPEQGPAPAERRLGVLLQVNVDDDPGKAGFSPAALEAGLREILELGALQVDGLMTIGRLVGEPEEARLTFRRLRELSARLRDTRPALGAELSMGMSDDFPVAAEEGATIVRVGRALFGARPAP